MNIRYSSWGSDKAYRWLWRAALQDGIFAFKNRYKKHRQHHACKTAKEADKQNQEILKDW